VKRRKARQIKVGKVKIGGNAPVSIQSMSKTNTSDVAQTVKEIKRLEKAGCDIIRLAIPNADIVKVIPKIKKKIRLPLVADIHFNYKLALLAITSGVDKIRINPGNITSAQELKEVARSARGAGIPIRIGLNSGSVKGSSGTIVNRMVSQALKTIELFEKVNFQDIVVSLKSSSVEETVVAYRKIARLMPYPLHLGVTAAGLTEKARIKSAIGIGSLLLDGIGDTIRVSIAGDPVNEVNCARDILEALGLRKPAYELLVCPTCGRCEIDVIGLAQAIDNKLKTQTSNLKPKFLKLAIMGCIVNGPGEAKEADLGVAGGKGCGIVFKNGKIVKKVSENKLVENLMKLIKG